MPDKIKQWSKHKLFWPVLYIVLIAVAAFYVNSVTSIDDIDVEVEKKKEATEVKPASVTLVIQSPRGTQNLEMRLQNTDSVEDLFEELYQDERMTYETTAYTYGSEISSVNGIEQTETGKWHVYAYEINPANDITLEIGKMNLVDEETYYLVYENRPVQPE